MARRRAPSRPAPEPVLHGLPTSVAGTAPPPLVAHDEPKRRQGMGVIAGLLVIVTLGALAHVGVRLKGLEVAYALGQERLLANELQEQRRRLQIEIGMLKDPGRVIAIARGRLSMGPPTPEAIWRLEGAAAGGAPTTATPVPAGATGPTKKITATATATTTPAKARAGGTRAGARSAGRGAKR